MPAPRSTSLLIRSAIVLAMPIFMLESAQAVVPDIKNFCIRYAGHATSEAMVAQSRNCGFTGPRWTTSNADHLNWCLSAFGDNPSPQKEVDVEKIANGEDAARVAAIQQCQANPPAPAPAPAPAGGGGGGQTLTAQSDVTMYDTFEDGNQDLCYIHEGDTFTKLAANGASGKWVHLKGNSGDCAGKTGYVYNDGELK